jgi:hypothetical protein
MTNKKDFNIGLMQEMGLEVKDNNIIDQDNGTQLKFKDRPIKFENARRDEVQFDPLTNPPMMNALFNYYLDKLDGEGRYVSTYHKSVEDRGEKGYVELKENKEEETRTIRSGNYHSDSVKYADLILKLNESKDDLNLETYDKLALEEQARRYGTK